jgi:16S rRNA (cytosine1407-C5)-methyltransferase
LNKGGTLVYSTCTLAPEENEWVIARLLANNADCSLEDIDIGLSDEPWWREWTTSFEGNEYGDILKKTVRILPSEETEGFFIAKIVKK